MKFLVIRNHHLRLYMISQHFMDFLVQKIYNIRMALTKCPEYLDNFVQCDVSFTSFTLVKLDDIILLVRKMTHKSCSLDPIPTQFVMEFLDLMAPMFCRIVNSSLKSSVFLALCKSALVRPLIKKSGLDRNQLKNYRPVSNITFLSKLLEKVVLLQLNSYFTTNSMYARCQSAYREHFRLWLLWCGMSFHQIFGQLAAMSLLSP